jgi:hypothetical protein
MHSHTLLSRQIRHVLLPSATAAVPHLAFQSCHLKRLPDAEPLLLPGRPIHRLALLLRMNPNSAFCYLASSPSSQAQESIGWCCCQRRCRGKHTNKPRLLPGTVTPTGLTLRCKLPLQSLPAAKPLLLRRCCSQSCCCAQPQHCTPATWCIASLTSLTLRSKLPPQTSA